MLLNASPPVKDFFEILGAQTGVKIETLFTVCTTLFVFCAGILSNWVIKKLNARTQRKNYKKTVNLLLQNLRDVCKKQYQVSIAEIDNFCLLNNKVVSISQHTYSSLPFLNKIDYSVFLASYIVGCNQAIKIKATSKLFKIISHANILTKDNEDMLKFFMDQVQPMQGNYIKNMLALEQYQRALPLKVFADYRLKGRLQEIFSEWQVKHTDNNFRTSFIYLITPLIKLLNEYPLEPQIEDISIIAQECHFCYSEIAHTDQQILRHFKNFSQQNKSIYRQLSVILKIFNYSILHSIYQKWKNKN